MIVLRTPKGWTGPKEVDGKQTEDYWRSHQVPMGELHENPEHLALLEEWMRSYRPEELFDEDGPARRRAARAGARRATGAWAPTRTPTAALLLRDLRLPDFRDYAVDVPAPGAAMAEATRVMGTFLRDVMKLNLEARNFRVFGPDETDSNRLAGRASRSPTAPGSPRSCPSDDHLAPDGRVMEMLSEHTVPGLARGLPADRPARLLHTLRGVHPHRRLDVQPARQVAEGDAATSPGGGRSPR